MKDKKVLYVSSEVVPYLPDTEMAKKSFGVAKKAHYSGVQTRIFMPRFGKINERRHQLHEVIRLSGMNLVINDIDMPLIIKVASIPKERMQVYFIDNEDYFKRKALYNDENEVFFKDNDERAIFFVKGIVETVKKLNWAPDIIHVHGWMGSLLPVYLREHYKDEPLFEGSKIITSLYNNGYSETLNKDFAKKVAFDGIDVEKIKEYQRPTHSNLMINAVKNSDAVIKVSEKLPKDLEKFVEDLKIPLLEYKSDEDYQSASLAFYREQFN